VSQALETVYKGSVLWILHSFAEAVDITLTCFALLPSSCFAGAACLTARICSFAVFFCGCLFRARALCCTTQWHHPAGTTRTSTGGWLDGLLNSLPGCVWCTRGYSLAIRSRILHCACTVLTAQTATFAGPECLAHIAHIAHIVEVMTLLRHTRLDNRNQQSFACCPVGM
jgi:hypothetical protein